MPKSAISQIALVGLVLILAIFAVSLTLSQRQNKREQMRATALPVTIKQAQPIIRAIKRYRTEKSTFPPSLRALVPTYIQQIPAAGPVAKDGWHYRITPDWQSGGWSLSVRVRDEYSPNIVGFGDTFIFHPDVLPK